jgi:hypothetical protein
MDKLIGQSPVLHSFTVAGIACAITSAIILYFG